MDHYPPTSSSSQQVNGASSSIRNEPREPRKRNISSIYALQVQAFLDAAEVVEADPEVIEDLLESFASDAHGEQTSEDNDEVDMGSAYFDGDDTEDDEGMSEWDALLREAQSSWSKQEIKEMTKWLKEFGIASFIQEYVVKRDIPIPKLLYAFGVYLCPELRCKPLRTLLYFLRVALSRELQSREKLPEYNTIDDAVSLIRKRKRILVLTGAGISVSCGIPDFRSRNGLYASLQESGEYDLDDPQQMFDIHYFRENPAVLVPESTKIYPSNFIPSPCHRFIKAIEDKGKLLRNYTQNIDTLETLAGVKRVLQCHGSFATASCLNCKIKVPGTDIEEDILNQEVPLCKRCISTSAVAQAKASPKKKAKKRRGMEWDSDDEEPGTPPYPPGIMKPDITFFGEKLSDEFDRALLEDRQEIDLLIIIGTSLKVSPVSDIIAHLPHSVPQILINKTPIKHINPDIVLLGNADDIVMHLARKLEWDLPAVPTRRAIPSVLEGKTAKRSAREVERSEPQRVGDSHVWLFQGAEGGKWVEEIARQYESQSDDGSPSGTATPTSAESSQTRKIKKARTGLEDDSNHPHRRKRRRNAFFEARDSGSR
ncbi:SIR2-domain-containing protein [Laetiporus sulphureus 93-53]|uniref:SIR2-domain-containing protein n=1 Tax=Laetiporus sulphureus 93-53 TaxID=1314785 RepID=A0A165G5H7_9APHY|nr:SIR2-domain-containing protein [Laetiporus sulphureus 93-53]KZT09855.1 SIR2-domain-containing protein [Laetiporus sulphureus 93-53]